MIFLKKKVLKQIFKVASKFGVSIDTVKESVEAHLSNPNSQNPNSPSDQYSVAYQLTIDNMNLQSKVILTAEIKHQIFVIFKIIKN